jgi:hypothetical protein
MTTRFSRTIAEGMSVHVSILLALLLGVPASPGDATAQVIDQTRYFSLHSDPWINLHHFLYQWARADLELGEGEERVRVAERESPAPLEDEWEAAVAFYRTHIGPRNHFDAELLGVTAALLNLAGDPSAEPQTPIEGLDEILSAAMPIYLRRWWTEHDRANRRLIARVGPDLRAVEERWVEVVSRLFGGTWSDDRLRVDMSAYANWQGAYTSNGPTHTVVWSRAENVLHGLNGLEMVLHESGHMSSLAGPFRGTFRTILRDMNVTVSPNLRHMLLFATAGWFVADVAEERGGEHVPYVVATGISTAPDWAPLWKAIQDRWLPAYRGRENPRVALVSIIEAVGSR